MNRTARLAVAVGLGAFVLVAGTGTVAAYAWQRAAMLRIRVRESGPGGKSFSLSLPGALVDAAIALCPPPAQVHGCLGRVRLADVAPVVGSIAAELDRLPDSVLLDVRDGSERVVVSKVGGVLRIRVTAPPESVDIDMPVATLRHAMEKFGRSALSAGA